jgi:hypothetical protein
MNRSPPCEQPFALAPRLLHDATQISAADASDPIQRYACWPSQDDLRFAAMPEHMHVRRAVVVGEDHESKAVSAVNGHHENNPSLLGFQGHALIMA